MIFLFENQFDWQSDGLAMVNPLSPHWLASYTSLLSNYASVSNLEGQTGGYRVTE